MRKIVVAGVVLSGLMLWNCGGKSDEAKEEPKNALSAIQEFAKKAEELQNKEPVEPVDFRELKNLLPETVAGIPRTEASGEKNGALGMTISQARGEYRNEEASVIIEIMDTGGIGGFGAMGVAAWALAETDKETSTGYERTVKIEGHKAFEKYDNEGRYGELKLMVADRYVLSLEGSNVEMAQLKSILKDIDLGKLEKLQ